MRFAKGAEVAICETEVHPADHTRTELIIPGEQHFYMKAVIWLKDSRAVCPGQHQSVFD